MIVAFVHGQTLRLNASGVVADTINYLTARFTFQTSDWDGLEVWAHFAKGEDTYDIRLNDGQITRDMRLNLSAGKWRLYLHGNRYDGGTVIQRVTTEVKTFDVSPTGILDGEPFPTVPPSAGEQIIASAQAAEAEAKEAAGQAARSESETKTAQKAVAEDRAEVTKTAEEIRQLNSTAEEAAGRAAKSAEDAEQARQDTADIKAAAEKSIDEKTAAALSDIGNAGAGAVAVVEQKATEGGKRLDDRTAFGMQAVVDTANTQIDNVNSTGQTQRESVEAAGETQRSQLAKTADEKTNEIISAANAGLTAIGNAGAEEIENIRTAGEAQVAAINTAGDAQTERVNAAGQEKLTEIAAQRLGAVLYDTPQELTDIQRMQGRDNVRAAGAIVESASGEVIVLTDAADAGLRGMVVYGKSTQDGTPTPDAPIDIVSVGGDGVTDVCVAAANLCANDWVTGSINPENGNEVTITSEVRCGFIRIPQNAILYISRTIATGYNKFRAYDIDKNYIGNTEILENVESGDKPNNPLGNNVRQKIFRVTDPNVAYIRFVDTSNDIGTKYLITVIGFDANVDDYHELQTLPISTPDGLCGIPVTSGGNYTDANGQQWICDEVDFVRGVRVQRVLRRVLTGRESSFKLYGTNDKGINNFVITLYDGDGVPIRFIADNGLCSHLPFTKTLYADATELGYHVSVWGTLYFRFYSANIPDVETMRAYLDEQIAEGTPCVYSCAIATPIETPLTESELAAYRALHTNCPNTTIYADDNAGLAVDYVADTKLYIDKKFAELSAAIISN